MCCAVPCRLYDGKVFCDFANEVKSGAVSELVSVDGFFTITFFPSYLGIFNKY